MGLEEEPLAPPESPESPPESAPEKTPDQPDPATSELAYLDPRRWVSLFSEVDREVWVVCIVAAIGLALHELVFRTRQYKRMVTLIAPEWIERIHKIEQPEWSAVMPYAYWVGGTLLSWVVLPIVAARLFLGRGPSDYGFRRLPLRKMGPYIAILAAMIPVIMIAAMWLPGFATKYPLFRTGTRTWTLTNLLLFEAIYGLQFVAVEFFFRGFLVNGLGRTLGYRAILVSMMPYVMIHFHKPFLEALAAIVAGIVLGAFALRTRSIWGGLLIHLGVAWGMDLVALFFGPRGFPSRW